MTDPASKAAARPQFACFLEPARNDFVATATEQEQSVVAEHFAYLQRLLNEGKLILAGRTQEPSPVGLVIFEADDENAATTIVAEDPAVKGGIFRARLAPYRVALLRGENAAD